MRIGLYSPYVTDIAGGGERYLLTLAECLLKKHRVDLIVPENKIINDADLIKKFSRIFNLNLTGLNSIRGPFGPNNSAWQRWQFTRQYDVFFYMTDGSFFIPGAKRNIVHFMVPFNRPPGFWQRFKLKFWRFKSTHSYFCRQALEKVFKIKIDNVQWGTVDASVFKPLKKKNIILNVGRFFAGNNNQHCKRQDFLVKTFTKMCDEGLKGWELILLGPIDPGKKNEMYLKAVKKLAQGYPVKFRLGVSFDQLITDYGQAKIYWHATGYGTDDNQNFQAAEHFGISTIEAMAAGAVPVVIKKGGQTEIVNHGINGLLWLTQKQLIRYTRDLINSERLWQKLARHARVRVKNFSPQKFCRQTDKIFLG